MKKFSFKKILVICSAFFLFGLAGCGSTPQKEIIIDYNERTTFSLNASKIDLLIGETFQLKPQSYVSQQGLTWYSSAKSIVRVDKNGCIEALNEGTAIISAYDDLSVGSVTVTVTSPKNKLSISLSINEITIGIGPDYSYRVSAKLYVDDKESNAYDITYTKRDETGSNVATVDYSGGFYTITGVNAGYVVFSFTATNGTNSAGANLYVTVLDAD